jgi:phosphoglycerate dehydrogenase-like enzyme
MKYKVEVTIYNSYEIEAESQEEAEQLARELDCHETLRDCDFNVNHCEEVRETNGETN